MTTLNHSVPVAVRNITEGVADLHEAVRHAETMEQCLDLRRLLKQLIEQAQAVENLSLRRADDLLADDLLREK